MSENSIMQTPVNTLTGVGDKVQSKLNSLNIYTIGDLLFHLPLRYENHTKISNAQSADPNQAVNICGTIICTNSKFTKKGPMVICTIVESNGTKVDLIFWNLYPNQQRNLKNGTVILAFGNVMPNYYGTYSMTHPSYKLYKSYDDIDLPKKLTPIYPQTQGLSSDKISNLINYSLKLIDSDPPEELLPAEYASYNLIDAIKFIHHPPVDTDFQLLDQARTDAQKRLILEELIAQTITVLQAKIKNSKQKSYPLNSVHMLQKALLSKLPFKPTAAQLRVIREINADLCKDVPMMRLLQGDVGSGKTLVAAVCALSAIENNVQVALMAPTEILAEQHYIKIKKLFNPLGIELAYLNGKQKSKERKIELEKISSGKSLFVIGTHALFQDQVTFKNLSLVIIDEQHRFGVEQRLRLLEKGVINNKLPHQLIMTATPIPRTLAMTSYADLAVSTIDELPPGRKPINTTIVTYLQKRKLLDRIKSVCCEKHWQIYWVCTLIEKSEALEDCSAADEVAKELASELPELKIGLVHGKLAPEDKQEIMSRFKLGEIDLLVATTVIEVGVDVPNANIIIIENPERLGLAQLHQLRGRVGRGQEQAYCILFCNNYISEESRQRLEFLKNNHDGLKIAEQDLNIRGPGEYIGTKQTGVTSMKIANFVRDQEMIPLANNIAHDIVNNHPELSVKLIQRWINSNDHLSNA